MNDPRQPPADTARDALTGLPGPETLRHRVAEWRAHGGPVAIHALLLGLRRFDAINLAYGSAAGDAALAEVALRLGHFASEELDGPFHVARSGGGNFLLVANEVCSRERWQLLADQLADVVARPIAVPAGLLRLSPRVALLRALPEEGVESMLDRLGQTFEAAQRLQGRRLAWAQGEAIRAGRTAAQLEADLLGAIDRDEIEVLYQPQFSSLDDRLSGAEALARWNHPQLGRIGAGALFTIAERADHVAPLSRHVAAKAMAGALDWPETLRLSLNVTPSDLAAGSYAAELLGIAERQDFPLDRLTLEVTEQALLSDVQLAERSLAELSAHGARIALDDFGAGFCNFRYLKILPLDYLKLDRSMIDGIGESARDLAVLRGIVAMAHALGLQVIAEGVETEDQRRLIVDELCAFYQGFLKAQPMDAEAFAALARS